MTINVKATPEQIMPEGAIPVGAIILTVWLDPETGEQRRSTWADVDAPITVGVGLLELAKLDLIYSQGE